MGRLLFISGLIFLGWIAYRFLKNTWSQRLRDVEQNDQRAQQAHQAAPARVQEIKACTYCKTHIPEDEGIYRDGKFFCSYQHLDRYLEHEQK